MNNIPEFLSFEIYRREEPHDSFARIDGNVIQKDHDRFVFQDFTFQPDRIYTYRVFINENDRTTVLFETTVSKPALSLQLDQNTPNPFNPTTRIRFVVEREQQINLSIYDISGMRIATLEDKKLRTGEYVEVWNGYDEQGNTVASGLYLFRLTAGKRVLARKAVLLK